MDIKNNTKPILLFGFPFWVARVLFWIGFIAIIVMAMKHEARQYVAIGMSLCIVSYILQKKFKPALTSAITFSIFWWVFLEWGVKGSLIASLIFMPVVCIMMYFQLKKMKTTNPEQYDKLLKSIGLRTKDKSKI